MFFCKSGQKRPNSGEDRSAFIEGQRSQGKIAGINSLVVLVTVLRRDRRFSEYDRRLIRNWLGRSLQSHENRLCTCCSWHPNCRIVVGGLQITTRCQRTSADLCPYRPRPLLIKSLKSRSGATLAETCRTSKTKTLGIDGTFGIHFDLRDSASDPLIA